MARQFDAGTERIDVGLIAALNNPSSFWVSAWLYLDALTQDGAILGHFNTSAGWVFFFDDVNPSGNNRIDFFVAHTVGNSRVSSSAEAAANEWNHWFAQYDSAANELRLYKNAILDNTTASVTEDPSSSSDAHTIGLASPSDSGRDLLGRLAHVRSGLGVLNIGQIKDLIYRGASGISTELDLPLWGSAVETDLSGKGNNGTVTGATVGDNPPVALQFGFDEPVPYAVAAAPAAGFTQRSYPRGVNRGIMRGAA